MLLSICKFCLSVFSHEPPSSSHYPSQNNTSQQEYHTEFHWTAHTDTHHSLRCCLCPYSFRCCLCPESQTHPSNPFPCFCTFDFKPKIYQYSAIYGHNLYLYSSFTCKHSTITLSFLSHGTLNKEHTCFFLPTFLFLYSQPSLFLIPFCNHTQRYSHSLTFFHTLITAC